MRDFSSDEAFEAISRNIASAGREYSASIEKRISHIFDAASLVCFGDGDDVLRYVCDSDDTSDILSFIPESTPLPLGSSSEFARGISEKNIENFDRLCFCKALAARRTYGFAEISEILLGAGDGAKTAESRKITMLRNAKAGRAFEIFARKLRGVEPAYEDNFNALCQAVSSGDASYAVLPVESSSDGRLDGIYRAMEKYGLCILMSCTVRSADGETTRFALAGKAGNADAGKCNKFEIKISLDSLFDLSVILDAAGFFGAGADSVFSLAGMYGRDNTFGITFDIENADITGFVIYLSLMFSQFVTVGIYPHITEE
ncbi:MAG: hypothetical protein KBS59_07960 [Clostridiales bacterium]|nr:hypothetical protein [Clostridiales bacterium]